MIFRTTIFLLFLLQLTQNTLSQDKTDSLLYELNLPAKPKSERLKILNLLTQSSESSLLNLKYSLQLYKESKDINLEFECNALQKIGQAHIRLGNLDSAVYYLLLAIEKSKDTFPQLEAISFGLLAATYFTLGDTAKSIQAYQNTIQAHRNLATHNDSIFMLIFISNLGDKLILTGELDTALLLFEEAQLIAKKTNYTPALTTIKGNIGLVYGKMGNTKQAMTILSEVIEQAEVEKNNYAVAAYQLYLAELLLENGNLPLAKEFATKSMEAALREDLKPEIKDAHAFLEKIHLKLGQFDKAYFHQKAFFAYRDSINDLETVKRIADLEKQQELQEKQAEINQVTAEKKRQETVLIASLLVALLLVVVVFLALRGYELKRKLSIKLGQQKEQLEELNKTKDKFFSIISHDLRSPIAAFYGISRMIKFFVENKKIEELTELAGDIDKTVDRLTYLLDNLLKWAMQQQGNITYNPEPLRVIELVKRIESQYKNSAKGKNIDIDISEVGHHIILADKNSCETILRNLVNNAIKFTPENGRVHLKSENGNARIRIFISDNGVGMDEEKIKRLFHLQSNNSTYGTSGEKGIGLGLQLVQDFLRMNQGDIQVKSKIGQGTTFIVSLPAA